MSEAIFAGFEPANTTPVPDILFDQLLCDLNGAELKALLYIIRRTRGFKKDTDAISLSQFQRGITTKDGRVLDHGCGVKDRTTLVEALASLEKKGCIKTNKTFKGNEHSTTLYSIRFIGDEVSSGQNLPPSRENTPLVVGKPDYPGRQTRPQVVGKSALPVVGKPDKQETVIQLNSKQETVIQDGDGATTHHAPTLFHPDYPFIGFDDLETPHTMYLYLLPLPDWGNAESVLHYSEQEDKRREWACRDVELLLASKGIQVRVEVRREHLGQTVEQATPSNHQESENDAHDARDHGTVGSPLPHNGDPRDQSVAHQQTDPGDSCGTPTHAGYACDQATPDAGADGERAESVRVETSSTAGLYESSRESSYSLSGTGNAKERGGRGKKRDDSIAQPPGQNQPARQAAPHQGRAQKPARVAVETRDPLAEASEEVKAIILEWQRASGNMTVNPTALSHATTLASLAAAPVPGEIAGCVEWLYANDKTFKQRPMYLGDIVNSLAGYRRAIKQKQQRGQPKPPAPTPESLDDPERAAKLEKCRQIQAHLAAQQAPRSGGTVYV